MSKPLLIAHRINTIEQLQKVPIEYGVELDLRDSNKKLIVTHDPYTDGVEFSEYVKHYKHKFMICNIKCEGIEYKVKEILDEHKIKDFFFLDSSFPMIIKLLKSGIRNVAVRYSVFESMSSIISLVKEYPDIYVWIDYLNGEYPIIENLKLLPVKTCLVSPELHSSDNLINQSIIDKVDMICTKRYK